MKTGLWILVVAVGSSLSFAQEPSSATTPEEIMESIIDGAADGEDLLPLTEELEFRRQHPVNIVTAQYTELLNVPFISPMLAEAIVLYRDSVRVESADQLLAIPIVTPELLLKLIPFITVEQPSAVLLFSDLYPASFESRTRIERRLHPSRGFRLKNFADDRNSLYQRFRIGGRYFETGGLMEKDAGEQWDNGFAAGYVSLRGFSFLKTLVIGNYHVSADQGLVFAKNFASTKGVHAVSQSRIRETGITPALSTDEHRYFRGAAAKLGNDIAAVTGFYSHRMMHATIDSLGTVTSFFTSGLFRTAGDQRKMNTLAEEVIGSRVEISVDRSFSVGLNALRIRYDRNLAPSLFPLASQRSIDAGSIGGSTLFDGMAFYGEMATNDGDRFSTVAGLVIPYSRKFSIGYHHRALSKGFVNPLARPFAERSVVSDGEKGDYLGFQAVLSPMEIASYIDLYSLPATAALFGANGSDVLLSMKCRMNRQFHLTAQVRLKSRWQSGIRKSDDERRQSNVRIGYWYEWNNRFSLSQRFEAVRVLYTPSRLQESGYLTFCEATYTSRENRWSAKGRLVFFDTDGYDSRLYQYESDVAGNFSNPPLFGRGIRWYCVAGYAIVNGIRCSAKYSETKMFGDTVIGSGDDEIVGLLDNAVALQLDFSF